MKPKATLLLIWFLAAIITSCGTRVLVRTDSRPGTLAATLRAAVRAVDPDKPVAAIRAFRD